MKNSGHFFLLFIILIFFATSTQSSESSPSSPCASNPCIKGICTADADNGDISGETPAGYRCFCFEGYTGVHCDHRYDHCLPGRNKCQNSGTCVNKIQDVSSSSSSHPGCICQPGFCGRFCEVEVDDCLSAPCLNGVRILLVIFDLYLNLFIIFSLGNVPRPSSRLQLPLSARLLGRQVRGGR